MAESGFQGIGIRAPWLQRQNSWGNSAIRFWLTRRGYLLQDWDEMELGDLGESSLGRTVWIPCIHMCKTQESLTRDSSPPPPPPNSNKKSKLMTTSCRHGRGWGRWWILKLQNRAHWLSRAVKEKPQQLMKGSLNEGEVFSYLA